MRRSALVWPAILICSGITLLLVVLSGTELWVRFPLSLWFLLVCPGMAVARQLRVGSALVEWMLAIAVSIALDGLVASVFVYAGAWSPAAALLVIVVITAGLAVLQLRLPALRWLARAVEVSGV